MVTDKTPCACRDDVPCLLHYAELPLGRQIDVAWRAGIETGAGSAGSNRSTTGRAERGIADGRQPRGMES